MAPKSYTGTPIPGITLEEAIRRERDRVAAWRASLPKTGSIPPPPYGRIRRLRPEKATSNGGEIFYADGAGAESEFDSTPDEFADDGKDASDPSDD